MADHADPPPPAPALYYYSNENLGLEAMEAGCLKAKGAPLALIEKGTTWDPKPGEVGEPIVLAHLGDAAWGKLANAVLKDQVLLRVSTAGFLKGSQEPVRRLSGGYVLHLRPRPSLLKAGDWENILTGVSDPKALASLTDGKNPLGLRYYFFMPAHDLLAALTILCQGYLCAHASAPADDAERKAVQDAVVDMGFDAAVPPVADPRRRRREVRLLSWWQGPFRDYVAGDNAGTLGVFSAEIKTQWDEAGAGEDAAWAPVQVLVDSIAREGGGHLDLAPKAVAAAYSSLSPLFRRRA